MIEEFEREFEEGSINEREDKKMRGYYIILVLRSLELVSIDVCENPNRNRHAIASRSIHFGSGAPKIGY